jgi:hypothetical protein
MQWCGAEDYGLRHQLEEMITLTGPLKIWTGADGSSHFMSVPEEISGEIRAHAMMVRRGFGSVKVEATIDDVTWRTSVFPSKSSGGYFLPVKIEVCRKTGLVAGDQVTVELELL